METGGKGIRRADEIDDGRRMRGVASVDRGQNRGVGGRQEVSAEGGVLVLAEAGGEAVSVEGLEKAGGEEVAVDVRDEFNAERKPVDQADHLSKMVGIGEEVTAVEVLEKAGGEEVAVEVRGKASAERKPIYQEDHLDKMAGIGDEVTVEVRGKASAEREPVDQEGLLSDMVGIGDEITVERKRAYREEEEVRCGKEEEELWERKQKEEEHVGLGKLTAEVNSTQGIFIGAGPVAGRPTGWADLPQELIRKIATDHLECAVDKICISLISRHWRYSMSAAQHMPTFPWLFLPSPKAPLFFNPASGCLHPVPVLPDDVRCLNPCGSCTGGWLFMNGRAARKNHMLYNFKTGARVNFSSKIIMVNDEGEKIDEDATSLSVCVASEMPSSPGCKVLGIIRTPDSYGAVVALWDKEEDKWIEISYVMDHWIEEGFGPRMDYDVLDMLFHNDAFHLLTEDEDIIRVLPYGQGVQKLHVWRRMDRQDDEIFEDNLRGTTIKYLVESTGGYLVMCIKNVRHGRTESTDMYRLSVPEKRWLNYISPEGEVILLGSGCSKAYLTEGIHSEVHFLDDTEKHVKAKGVKLYTREDMGGFRNNQRHYSAPAELLGSTSTLSRPVWFHH